MLNSARRLLTAVAMVCVSATIALGQGGGLSGTVVDSGGGVAESLARLGIERVDESELKALCEQLVADNPRIAADVRSGKLQAAGALVGQAKKRNPNADPNRIRELCIELIQSSS